MRRKRKKIIAMIMAAGMMMGLAGCGTGRNPEAPELKEPVSVSMDTALVEKEDIYQLYTCDAQIVPVTTEVTTEYSGILSELSVREGDWIREGEILARFSDEAVRTQLAAVQKTMTVLEAQNQLSNEIAEYELELLRLEEGSEYEIEKAELLLRQQKEDQELEMRQLREQEQELQEQLIECEILAPASGRIAYTAELTENSMVQEGYVLAVIASEDELRVRTEFQTDWLLTGYDACRILYGGREIPVEPLAYDRNDYVAAVLRNGSFYSYYALTEQPEGFQAGDYAQLQIMKERREQVCVIPLSCLYRDSNGYYVYRIGEDGNRIKTPVAVGVKNDLMAEITDGLTEGDEVYVKD